MDAAEQASRHDYGYPEHWEADVVLRDGGTARIRPIRPDDADRLVAFYNQVSDESKYFRFFAPYPRLSDRDVRRFTHHDYVNRVGLAALIRDAFVATVRFDRIDATGRPAEGATDAEVAFLVQDDQQGRGIASALLEHASAVARERGIRRFIAEVLPENRRMAKVFTDAGYTQTRSFADGVLHLELDLEPTEQSLAVMRAREHRAEARSVQRLLSPRSVAVVGAGRRPGGIGRALLRDLLAGGFTGSLHAVNHAAEPGTELDGVPVHRSVRDIPEPVDLAVLAVPATEVPGVVADCGRRGVRGLVVVSAGYAESGPEGRERQLRLVAAARAAGMRVIGPNAFGLLNTAPDIRLNASLAPQLPDRGRFGIFTQSGAIGAALLETAYRRGLGVSSLVSAGHRADVSGNDLLQYWAEDPATDVVLLYLESFGNPRKFTRLARRIAETKPVVVVKGGRHTGAVPPGHAAVTPMADSTVDTLFQQAGVIRAATITDLFDTAELLAHQPLPAGPRVAVLGNSDSMGALTYDACLSAGLEPRVPVDLGTEAAPEDFRAALGAAVSDPDTDAVVVVAIPRLGASAVPGFPGSDLVRLGERTGHATRPEAVENPDTAALAAVLLDASREAAEAGRTLLVVHLAVPGLPELLRRHGTEGLLVPGSVPAYPSPERAVDALAHALRYATWRRAAGAGGRIPEFGDIDEEGARKQVQAVLRRLAEGGDGAVRLADDEAAALLARYGIHVLRALPAPDEEAAARAAAELGYPVALKSTAPHLRHRPDLGSVRLDLGGEAELRRAYRETTDRLGGAERARLVVQHLAERGVDTVVSASVDPAVGAILSFGLAGAPAELLGDLAHRLVPATDRDVAALVREVRASPLLFGWRGAAPVDTDALELLLLRVSRLVDDLPEVSRLELEPIVVARRGLAVLGAGVTVARPPLRTDVGPRAMPPLR